MKKIILSISGMTCSACSNSLEKYLNKQNGVIEAQVNLVMAIASITYDDKILNQEIIESFIKKAGFLSNGLFKDINYHFRDIRKKYVFIIMTFLAVSIMYISMGHMLSIPTLNIFDMNINPIGYGISQFITCIIFLIYGFDIIRNGIKNIFNKSPNMDSLVMIGVLSSFSFSIFGLIKIFQGNLNAVHELYFESPAIVIYFIKMGRYIDGLSKDKTKEAIKKLVEITPNEAIVLDGESEKKVTLDEIKKNMIVISRPGEKIAVDGEIIEGQVHLDETFITGESKPSKKIVGDKVIAGSYNYDGYIKYKAKRIGKESTISEIVRLVIEATGTKAPIALIADKISGYFVPGIIIIALITFLGYLILDNSFSYAIIHFVTVLVVACPCSLGLATPLAMVVSEGTCAFLGILVKKNDILENASKVNTVVFDKTGTLTYGRLSVSRLDNFSKFSDNELMNIIASLEKKSSHPIAKAFENVSSENGFLSGNTSDDESKIYEVFDFEEISGYGIIGKINGNNVILGNRKILSKYNISNEYLNIEEEISSKGDSIIYVVINNVISAIVGVSDTIREGVREVINKLNSMNIETIMLTGDNDLAANNIASKLKISKVISNVFPSEKLDVIRDIKNEGKIVLMCGDGINDSPAIALSDIGVSIKSGTDIAMDSADVILLNNDLNSLIKLIDISKKTVRIIKENLFWAFVYNVIMIPIAMGLFTSWNISISPMIASLAMVLSSFAVVINALRLKDKQKFNYKRSKDE